MKVKVLYVLFIVIAIVCANKVVAQNASEFYSTSYSVAKTIAEDDGGSWEQVGDFPSPSIGHTCVVVNGKIHVIGGWSNNSQKSNKGIRFPYKNVD